MEVSSCVARNLLRLLHADTRLRCCHPLKRNIAGKVKRKPPKKAEADPLLPLTCQLPTMRELECDRECKKPLFQRRKDASDLYILESQWAADLARLAKPLPLNRNDILPSKASEDNACVFVEACPGPGFITRALLERYPKSPVLTFCSSSVYIRFLNKLKRFYGENRLKVLHPYKLFALSNSFFRLAHSVSGLRPKKRKDIENDDNEHAEADDDADLQSDPKQPKQTRLALSAERVYDAIATQIEDLPQRRLVFIGLLPEISHTPFIKTLLHAKTLGVAYDKCIDFSATLVVDERIYERLTYVPPQRQDADFGEEFGFERHRDVGYAAPSPHHMDSMLHMSTRKKTSDPVMVDDTIQPLFARLRAPQTTIENVQPAAALPVKLKKLVEPSLKRYSALTVMMNLCFRIDTLGTIPRKALYPNPMIRSAKNLETYYIIRITSRSWSDIAAQMGLQSREQLVEASFLVKELMMRRKEPLIWRLETWMPNIAEHLILHPSGMFDTYQRVGELTNEQFGCLLNVVLNSELWRVSPLRHNFLVTERGLSEDDLDSLLMSTEDENEDAEEDAEAAV